MTAGSLEPASVVGRSDIVLERPNLLAREAMPLGNGRLGVAVWGEEGFTAQLNRADTLPNRLSPGLLSFQG
jgi:alpha-L-fucosidase 2